MIKRIHSQILDLHKWIVIETMYILANTDMGVNDRLMFFTSFEHK